MDELSFVFFEIKLVNGSKSILDEPELFANLNPV